MFFEGKKMNQLDGEWQALWYLLKMIWILSSRNESEYKTVHDYIRENVFLPSDLDDRFLYLEKLNPFATCWITTAKPSGVVTFVL